VGEGEGEDGQVPPTHSPPLHLSLQVLGFPSSQVLPSVFLVQVKVPETEQSPAPLQKVAEREPVLEQVEG